MAGDEEYELVPHKIVSELKKEVQDLKQNPLGSSTSGHDLQGSMNSLAHSINDLVTLFKDATDQMRMEEKDSQVLSKRMEPMLDKLDTIIDQNHKIAKGILAVADMLHEHLRHKPKVEPAPQRIAPPPLRQPMRQPFPEFGLVQESAPTMNPPMTAPPFTMDFGTPGGPVPPATARQIPPAPAPPRTL